MQNITLQQLAENDGKNGRPAWIRINHEVFNVSTFLDFHPGGKAALQKIAGQDATADFALYHGVHVLPKYHAKFKIGEIAEIKQKQDKLEQKRDFARKSLLLDPERSFGDQVPYGDPAFYQRQAAHSPYYKPTHLKFRAEVREFVEREIIATMQEWKTKNRPPPALVEKMGKAGYLACMAGGKPFPKDHVDPGTPCPEDFDFFHIQILLDEISRCGDSAILSALTNGPSIAVCALLKFGNEELKQSGIIREVLMGRKMIALAVTEPVGGSDVASLSCELDMDTLTLTGNKKFITNGMYADYLTLLAKEKQTGQMTMVVVDCQSEGFTAIKCKVRGSELSGTSLLDFVQCKIAYIVGQRGSGFKMQMAAFNFERWYVSVCAVRLARNLLEESIRYCIKRKTFGKALHEHQAVRMRIAEMIRDIESVQAWMDSITYQMDKMEDISRSAVVLGDVIASAKVQVSMVYERCARHCTHIFGGNSLQIDSVGGRVESSLIQMKGYMIPAGAADILDDFTVRSVFRMAQSVAKL